MVGDTKITLLQIVPIRGDHGYYVRGSYEISIYNRVNRDNISSPLIENLVSAFLPFCRKSKKNTYECYNIIFVNIQYNIKQQWTVRCLQWGLHLLSNKVSSLDSCQRRVWLRAYVLLHTRAYITRIRSTLSTLTSPILSYTLPVSQTPCLLWTRTLQTFFT